MFNMLDEFALTEQQAINLNCYRLARIRQIMAAAGVDLCIINNPVSLRYAIDFDEYQLFQAHIPTVYLILPISGPVRMYGAAKRHYYNVDEYHKPIFVSIFDAGVDLAAPVKSFLDDIADFRQQYGLHGKVAIERFSPLVTQQALQREWHVMDGEAIMEQARQIKSDEEILCIRRSIAVAQHGMQAMKDALRPGMTENQLLSILHQVNVAHGGNWLDGRMLASGHRTNPWLQEATDKVIQDGELVGFDTDMIGPQGYLADVSRTWLCGDKPNQQQRDAYRHAYDEITYNTSLVKPGITFQALSEQAFARQARFINNRYVCCFHGAGLCDEYPKIYYREDWPKDRFDGVIQENMVLCVESFSGADGEKEGVKLENQVLVTANGCELLSNYPAEEVLLGHSQCL